MQLLSYDTLGHLVQVRAGRTDAGGTNPAADVVTSQMQYVYDDLGRLLKEWDGLGSASSRFTAFAYDVHGNVTQRTDPRGQVTSYSWAYGHRLSGRTSPAGDVGIVYNALGLPVQASTYPAGSSASPLVRYGFEYLPGRRLSKVFDDRATPAKTLTYRYSPGGRIVARDDGEGRVVDYQYDAVGRLSSVRFADGARLQYTFDPGGRLVRKSYPNGIAAVYSYHPDDSLIAVTHGTASSLDSLTGHSYGYDSFARRSAQTVKVNNAIVQDERYGYDALDRLLDVRTPAGALIQGYSYDPLGNRTTRATPSGTDFFLYDAANQLVERRSGSVSGTLVAGYVHDAAGHLVQKCEGGTVSVGPTSCTGATVTALTYDAISQLTEVAKTALPLYRYSYDHQGRRVKEDAGGTLRQWRYDGDDIVGEYGASFTAASVAYTHGLSIDEPLQRLVGSTPSYYHQDGINSAVVLSNASGTALNSQRFDAWGNQIAGTALPGYGYTGREPDATGLIYYRARYYDPALGRFTQRDPIGLRGGMNVFAYANSNPVSRRDPTGLLADGPTRQVSENYWNTGLVESTEASQFAAGYQGLNVAHSGATATASGATSNFSDYLLDQAAHPQASQPQDPVRVAAGSQGLITWEADPDSPFALRRRTGIFPAAVRGSPEELALATTITMISSGAHPLRETLTARDLQLPGSASVFYEVYSVGPPNNPGRERIATLPGSNVFYYSPYHYRPGPGAPNTWIRLIYNPKNPGS